MLELKSSAVLLDKKVKIGETTVSIYGLAHLKSFPKYRHLGKYMLQAVCDIAEKDKKYCVVGYCSDKVLPFYLKCGWFKVGDKWDHRDHNIISSKDIKDLQVSEVW